MNYTSNPGTPILSKPNIVGYMSVGNDREYRADISELKFVNNIPSGKVSFDLNHNIQNAIKRTSKDNVEKIDLLLKFVLDQSKRFNPDVHFITYRRTLISVMCSAFGLEPIIVVASLYKGNIYLCSIVTPDKVEWRNNIHKDEQQSKFLAWGYKFEQFMSADLPSLQPDIEKIVVENAEFSYICEATLGNHKLLYGSQIDGLLATNGLVPDPPRDADYETNINYLKQNSFVELKTNRIIEYRKQEENFKRRKMLYCWGQCYLAGLKGLIVGYRDDHGIVLRLEYFDTEDIVKYCKGLWDPKTALGFLDYFLTYIKNTFKNYVKKTENCNFKEIGPITLQFNIDVRKNITYTDKCESILPDWFIEAKKY